ncbi:MAG: outer membrane protein assembly factor BamD [Verrucomicrobiota bacterium]
MNFRVRALIFCIVALVSFPLAMKAPVVFKPNDNTKYVAPGEEELSGNAKELFEVGQKAEKQGNFKRAISAYKTLARRNSRDALAPGALYRAAELQEKLRFYMPAAESYRMLMERYSTSPHFNEAIEAQFRIGEIYLAGRKLKVLGIPVASALDHAVEIFAAVVRTAPYGKYTARAQFDIGLAREKQGANDAALQAYQAVIDKFPNEPIAASAQYQIGYIWFTATRGGTQDIAAATNAKIAFQDFLYRYPNSEKAAQARSNLKLLEGKQTTSSFQVAQFYDKQKNYRAAVIYYNEVIKQQPGSRESENSKRRIDQLRKKFGEAALQPEFVTEEAKKKKDSEKGEKPAEGRDGTQTTKPVQENQASGSTPAPSEPPRREEPTSSSTMQPASPPPALDLAMPPSSLTPDRTLETSTPPEATAPPEPAATPEATATPEASPTPEESPTPEASTSPTP